MSDFFKKWGSKGKRIRGGGEIHLGSELLFPWWQELPKRPCHGGLLGASASAIFGTLKVHLRLAAASSVR